LYPQIAPKRIVADPTRINHTLALRKVVGIEFLVCIITPIEGRGNLHVRDGLAVVSNIKIKNKKIRIFNK
jgi:hypothetical protein